MNLHYIINSMQLHDPHMISEPVLVLSGLTYLIPAYMSYEAKKYYYCNSLLFLTFTTVGFHSTRKEYFFILDIAAILNYIIYSSYLTYYLTDKDKFLTYFTVSYSLITYFGGKKYNVLSFDPDWNIQMFFHSLMHLFTSYSSYKVIKG